jgi:hypothetical protein
MQRILHSPQTETRCLNHSPAHRDDPYPWPMRLEPTRYLDAALLLSQASHEAVRAAMFEGRR